LTVHLIPLSSAITILRRTMQANRISPKSAKLGEPIQKLVGADNFEKSYPTKLNREALVFRRPRRKYF
jgi:hypothetical protein